MNSPRPLVVLLLIPSFYGIVSWSIWFGLYLMRLIAWDEPSLRSLMIFSLMWACFLLSSILCYPFFRGWARHRSHLDRPVAVFAREERIQSSLAIGMFHVLGLAGLYFYLRHLSARTGGYSVVFQYLTENSNRIREANVGSDPFGLELSYFGWIAIGLTAVVWTRGQLSGWLIVLTLAQLAGNFLFIDRTRPTTILFTVLLIMIPIKLNGIARNLVIKATGALALFVGVFIGIALWGNKIQENPLYAQSVLPPWARSLYAYGTGGFAYFNEQVRMQESARGLPLEVMYPLFKVLSALGLAPAPPSQVLDFLYVPFPMNVGTILQPFYADGGVGFLIFGMLLSSFGLNLLGLYFLRMESGLAYYAWTHVCFVAFMAFFSPKIASPALWLVCGVAVAVGLLANQKNVNAISSPQVTTRQRVRFTD